MSTVLHTELFRGMLGNATHSTIVWDTDNVDASLLDQTDSGTITSANVDYDEVNAATVVATADVGVDSVSTFVMLDGPVTFTSVTGDVADYLTVFKNSGSAATSPLAVTYDSASTGLPVTPNGENIVATWGSDILLTVGPA